MSVYIMSLIKNEWYKITKILFIISRNTQNLCQFNTHDAFKEN